MRNHGWVRVLVCWALLAAAAAGQELKIYFIDVDGGQATLVVSDTGESMLVDAGWPGFEGRDTEKILAAAKDAGLSRIDVLLVTHYHTDHVGGVAQLAERIPIGKFVDHGPNLEQSSNASRLYQTYLSVREKGEHLVVNPGDSFALGGATINVVSARKELLGKPLKASGAGVRPAICADVSPMKGDGSENEMSIGIVVEFGAFRMLDLADLLWNEEMALVCPENKIGDIDLYLTSHHGFRTSNNTAMVNAIRPRVAVMNNGTKKGGDPERWNTVKAVPTLVDRWQTQKSVAGDGSHNTEDEKIASLEPRLEPAWIRASVRNDGSFTVTNSRNGFSQSYEPRR